MSNTDFNRMPHVKPITSISRPGSKLLALQHRRTCFSAFFNAQLSLKITFAPNFAANIPGNAVPQPISSIRLPLNLSRWSHRNLLVCDQVGKMTRLNSTYFGILSELNCYLRTKQALMKLANCKMRIRAVKATMKGIKYAKICWLVFVLICYRSYAFHRISHICSPSYSI